MQEIQEKYNLKIYIDNVFCDPTEDVSCPRSIIISYKSQVITLKNHNLMGVPKLEVQYVWSYDSFNIHSEIHNKLTLSILLLVEMK